MTMKGFGIVDPDTQCHYYMKVRGKKGMYFVHNNCTFSQVIPIKRCINATLSQDKYVYEHEWHGDIVISDPSFNFAQTS